MTNKVYKEIKEHTPDDLMLNIKLLLTKHYGEYLSKEEMAKELFHSISHYVTDTDGNKQPVYLNTTRDRQIRDAVADLVIWFAEPIVTNTNGGGFGYARATEEIDENIADLKSRIANLSRRCQGLESARIRVFHESYDAAKKSSQQAGFGW